MADITDQIIQKQQLLTINISSSIGGVEIDTKFHKELEPQHMAELFESLESAARKCKKRCRKSKQ